MSGSRPRNVSLFGNFLNVSNKENFADSESEGYDGNVCQGLYLTPCTGAKGPI